MTQTQTQKTHIEARNELSRLIQQEHTAQSMFIGCQEALAVLEPMVDFETNTHIKNLEVPLKAMEQGMDGETVETALGISYTGTLFSLKAHIAKQKNFGKPGFTG